MDASAYKAYVAEKRKGTLRLMRYLPKSDSERQEMLEAIGVRSASRSCFSTIPENASACASRCGLPGPLSEEEIIEYFRARAEENAQRLHLVSGRRRIPASSVGGAPMRWCSEANS